MMTKNRMSPVTALFLGFFGVGAVGIASGAAVVLYTLDIASANLSRVVGLADNTLSSLPDLIESLPASLQELLNDRRDPSYAANLDIKVGFVPREGRDGMHPVLNITNRGDKTVSMLAVRVAALNESDLPIREWTEVVATPIAIDHDWRGPLFPGATRHIVLSTWRGIPKSMVKNVSDAVEISELRVWQGDTPRVASAD